MAAAVKRRREMECDRAVKKARKTHCVLFVSPNSSFHVAFETDSERRAVKLIKLYYDIDNREGSKWAVQFIRLLNADDEDDDALANPPGTVNDALCKFRKHARASELFYVPGGSLRHLANVIFMRQ